MTDQQTEQHAEPQETYLDGYAAILAQVAGTGRRLTRDELEERRLLGERAAEAGHSLRALVRLHLDATRASWPGGTYGAGVTDSVLAAVAQAVDAFAEGYERAQRLAVRQEEAARREFIDDLLYGRSDLGRLAERAERFGLVSPAPTPSRWPRGPRRTTTPPRSPGSWRARSSPASATAAS